MSDPSAPQRSVPPPAVSPRTKAGFTVPEYKARVWDMAYHVIHPAALYVVASIAGAARLLAHPLADEPGTGVWIEMGLFAGVFLGAWACFYSTLLRDAGLASRTITVLVPVAWITALVLWLAAPEPASLTSRAFAAWMCAVAVPGAIGWLLTMRRWRRHRREQAHILAAAGENS